MWHWLKKILIGKPDCQHVWEEQYQIKGEYKFGGGVACIHVLRCTKCGDMKKFHAC